ncbi:MAG: LptF/LptG family permease [Nitrospirota bacterium]
MKIIQRHYIGEFFKLFFIVTLGLSLIFSLLDIIDKVDDFRPGESSIDMVILYVLLSLPKYLLYLMPIATLICSLFIFGQASRNKELVIVKATGGRLKTLFYPFIISGIFLSIFSLLIGEFVIPDFTRRSYELKYALEKKGQKFAFKEGTLWLRSTDGSPVRIELYIPDKKIAVDVSIFVYGKGFLKKRIEAEKAEWIETGVSSQRGIWMLRKATIYDVESGKISGIAEMEYPNLESPNFFSDAIKKPEEMGMVELYEYAKRLNNAGFRNTKLIVDLNLKGSYPLTNFFMLLLGISLSLRNNFGGGLFAAGLGLFISLLYWLGYTLMLSLGYAGIVPPFLSAWTIPILFGIAAIFLFVKIPD